MVKIPLQKLSEYDDIENIAEIQEAIYAKIHPILHSHSDYHIRIIKAEKFRHQPLHIYSRPLVSRRSLAYPPPDYLANLLSLAAPYLPPSFTSAICRFVFIPEVIVNSQHLLTHVYLPQEKLVVFYLCSPRFFPGVLKLQDFIQNEHYQKRLGQHADPLMLLKLWGRVFRICLDCSKGTSKQLYTFLLPSHHLSWQEIRQLEGIQDLYERTTLS